VLVGYSWGAAVTALANPVSLAARVLVAPPVSMIELAVPGGAPTLVLVPAHDQYGPPDDVRRATRDWPSTTTELVDGIDHFLVGAIARISDRTVTWVTAQL
jgi:pimeloyl-ACP methyl ester carboxylesterase